MARESDNEQTEFLRKVRELARLPKAVQEELLRQLEPEAATHLRTILRHIAATEGGGANQAHVESEAEDATIVRDSPQAKPRMDDHPPISAEAINTYAVTSKKIRKQLIEKNIKDLAIDEDRFKQAPSTAQISPGELPAHDALANMLLGQHTYFAGDGTNDGTLSRIRRSFVATLFRGQDPARIHSYLTKEDFKLSMTWLQWYLMLKKDGKLSQQVFNDPDCPGLQVVFPKLDLDHSQERLRRSAPSWINSEDAAAGILEACWLVGMAEPIGRLTREECTDFLLILLNERIEISHADDRERYADFLIMLYCMLYDTIRDSGDPSGSRLQSLAAIGDLAGQQRNQVRFLHLAIAIYSLALEEVARSLANANASREGWTRARIVSNNLSGHLSTMLNLDGGQISSLSGDRLRMARLVNRMQVINACGNAITDGQEDRFESLWQGLGLRVADSADMQAKLVPFVRAMNNVLSGWYYLDPIIFSKVEMNSGGMTHEDLQLAIAAVGSLLRAAHAEKNDVSMEEPGSSLFNAGLSTDRVSRNQKSNTQVTLIRKISLCFYIAGISWACKHGESIHQVFDQYHAGSCAVNLTGKLAQLKSTQLVGKLESTIKQLADHLYLAQAGLAIEASDWHKIRNSLEMLYGQTFLTELPTRTARTTCDPREVWRLVTTLTKEVMADLMPESGSKPAEDLGEFWGEQNFAMQVAPVLRIGIGKCAYVLRGSKDEEAGFHAVMANLQAILDEAENLINDGKLLERLCLPNGASQPSALSESLRGSMAGNQIERDRLKLSGHDPEAPLPNTYMDWFNSPNALTWLRTLEVT